jgi:hypothetical protein
VSGEVFLCYAAAATAYTSSLKNAVAPVILRFDDINKKFLIIVKRLDCLEDIHLPMLLLATCETGLTA